MDEIREMNKTARTNGAVGASAIVPKAVRKLVWSWVNGKGSRFSSHDGPEILDYGAGPTSMHARALCDEGYDCNAYDIGDNVDLEFKYNEPLNYKYDIVYASNVLNVQLTMKLFDRMMDEVTSVMRADAVFIANYPRHPRKGVMEHVDMRAMTKLLKTHFGSVERDGFIFYCRK